MVKEGSWTLLNWSYVYSKGRELDYGIGVNML